MKQLSIVRYRAQYFLVESCLVKSISRNISLNLKQLRKERGWSLDRTADETGVSKAMLGQIERGESSPTIVTLWKIAGGFHTPFSVFLEKPSGKASRSRNKGSSFFHSEDEKMHVKPIFPFDPKLRFEMFVIQLLPHYEHLSVPHEKGVVEHIVVVEGEIEVLVESKWKRLTRGESIQFEAHQPHGYRNPSEHASIFHDIIHYPNRENKESKYR